MPEMNGKTKSGRTIDATPKGSVKKMLLSWEGALALIFVGVLILGACISPTYTAANVLREMPRYLAEIFMMFIMGYILIIGEIDISVGAIVCLAATVSVFASNAGLPMPLVIILCLLVGLGCGSLNGFILTHFQELPAMIVTLGTQIIFRGIAEVSMGSGGSVSLIDTSGFAAVGQLIGPFPLAFFFVIIAAVVFIVILAKTTFGRKLYAIGSNRTAALFAGIPVQRNRQICFSLLGLMAGVCAVFMVSTSFAANTTTGQGFEMEVIAMCVFGGIATTGGKGNLIGALIAGFTIVCLQIALRQINVNPQLILVITGVLLIVSVLIPGISQAVKNRKKAVHQPSS